MTPERLALQMGLDIPDFDLIPVALKIDLCPCPCGYGINTVCVVGKEVPCVAAGRDVVIASFKDFIGALVSA